MIIIKSNSINKNNVERYKIYFLALGFSLIEYSIMIYAGLWDIKLNKPIIKGARIILREFGKFGIFPLLALLFGLVIILGYFIKQMRIISQIYGILTLTSLILAPIIFLEWLSKVKLNFLISIGIVVCFSWISYTVITGTISIYKWTVKDKTTMLAKLTFIWSVLAAVLGYCIGRAK